MLLTWALYQHYQTRRYNVAAAEQDWVTAANHGGAYGEFAAAYVLQQQGDWQQALQAYSQIAVAEDSELAMAIRFNSANAYLQGALAVDGGLENTGDLTVPLVELAKTSYRDLLQLQPQHWDAKYNLERALQLFPDVAEQPVSDWQAPERGPQALISIEARQQLP